MNGILNLNKPAGITSFKAVSRIKRLAGGTRTGHAGTLDPFATGVLPIMIGQARRVTQYLLGYCKSYRAVLLLGRETDTLDVTGRTVDNCSWEHVSREKVESALARFKGVIDQVPPVYSAVKQSGRRLYEMAREGQSPVVVSRKVAVYQLELVDFRLPFITIDITCGKGTYIRSLARDIGKAVGSCACLSELARTSYGPFNISCAVSLSAIDSIYELQKHLQPMDIVLRDIPRVILKKEEERLVCNGMNTKIELPCTFSGLLRAYNRKGELVALISSAEGQDMYKPVKVFVDRDKSLTT